MDVLIIKEVNMMTAKLSKVDSRQTSGFSLPLELSVWL